MNPGRRNTKSISDEIESLSKSRQPGSIKTESIKKWNTYTEPLQVVVAGMECSGSTFVYQVLMGIGVSPLKIHHYTCEPSIPIVTYRDPRDIICSYARRQLLEITQSEGLEAGLIASHKKLFNEFKRHEVLRRYRDDGCLLICYEEYFNGCECDIIDVLSKHLHISVDQSLKQHLLKECSIQKNMERSCSFADFSEYDPRTHIHGNHISNKGISGVWKELFTETVREIIKKDLSEFLIEFGYENDSDW